MLGWFQQGQTHLEAKACQEPIRNVIVAVPAFRPGSCSEKDSPQFIRKLWDDVERLPNKTLFDVLMAVPGI